MFLKHLSQIFKKRGLKHRVNTSCQLEEPSRKSGTQTTPNAGEHVEQREFSPTAGGDAPPCRSSGRRLGCFLQNHTLIRRSSDDAPW